RLLNMEGEQRRIAIEFLRIDAFGQFFAGWTAIASSALRGSGDTLSPLRVLIVTNLVNVVVSVSCTFGVSSHGASLVLVTQLGVIVIVFATSASYFCGASLIT